MVDSKSQKRQKPNPNPNPNNIKPREEACAAAALQQKEGTVKSPHLLSSPRPSQDAFEYNRWSVHLRSHLPTNRLQLPPRHFFSLN